MKEALSVLHLASFRGNTGDVLNHIAFRPWFESLLGREVKWVDLEVRGYFRRQWAFDENFLAEVNRHDMFVIGGGNYFETWPSNSRSGTSIDLLVEDFERVRVPVFINSIGVDTGQGISMNAAAQLPRLLDHFSSSQEVLMSVRNDGAMHAAGSFGGEAVRDWVIDLPDAGFFMPITASKDSGHQFVGLNLACDMPEIRFANGDPTRFVAAVADFMTRLSLTYPDVEFKLFQHIYSDVSILSMLLMELPDHVRRERVHLVGLSPGEEGALSIAHEYASCSVVVANRFHSAVIPIGMGIATIGIETYPQVRHLFDDLSLSNWCVDGLDAGTLSDNLLRLVSGLCDSREVPEDFTRAVDSLSRRRATASQKVRDWLVGHGLTS